MHELTGAALEKMAGALRLLADCYYPPSAELGDRASELYSLLSELCPQAAAPMALGLEGLRGPRGGNALQVDYARLFVGPFSLLAPPYGSVYLEDERRVMGESTMQVRAWLAEEGLDLAEDFHEAPDHIAVELELLHFLACREVAARQQGDARQALYYQQRQRRFLEQHLGQWVDQFSEQMELQAGTAFYQALARATRELLAVLREQVGASEPAQAVL
jgi:TorA maturation chaperone TorD